jgi:hypothetical protein
MTTETITTERPLTLTLFKRIFFVSLIIGLVVLPLQWHAITTTVEDAEVAQYLKQSLPFVLGTMLVVVAVAYIFLCLIADEGRTIPKWLFVIWIGVGSAMVVVGLPDTDFREASSWVVLIQLILQTAALPLVFTPSARGWFALKREERKAAKAQAAQLAA